MLIYRRTCFFSGLLHLLIVLQLHPQIQNTYSLLRTVRRSENLAHQAVSQIRQRVNLGVTYQKNVKFTVFISNSMLLLSAITWLYIFLYCCGDIHPNPGPSSSTSSESFMSSSSTASNALLDTLSQNHHLSFVHYNVQSLLPKLDILQAEFYGFDLVACTETWLHPAIDNVDLLIPSFNPPERKDRQTDRYGGVILYVKESLHYRRRCDLEPKDTECIWVEIISKHKHVLFGVFYRPPNADSEYFTAIETSLNLAVDTGFNDIIVTGDFNFNMLTPNTARKINSLCSQFALQQSIDEPTHYTETSSSMIDLILVHNPNTLITSGVGEMFLNQALRYHCPVFGLLKFSKPKAKSFTRHIWYYDQGDFQLLRTRAAETDWNSLRDDNLDIYA